MKGMGFFSPKEGQGTIVTSLNYIQNSLFHLTSHKHTDRKSDWYYFSYLPLEKTCIGM